MQRGIKKIVEQLTTEKAQLAARAEQIETTLRSLQELGLLNGSAVQHRAAPSAQTRFPLDQTGRRRTPEQRRRMSRAQKRAWTPERRKRHGEMMRERWNNQHTGR